MAKQRREKRERRLNSKIGKERAGRRRLDSERQEMERQVAAGRDDEAVVLDVEDVNGVALDAGSPDTVLARRPKRLSSLAIATRSRGSGRR